MKRRYFEEWVLLIRCFCQIKLKLLRYYCKIKFKFLQKIGRYAGKHYFFEPIRFSVPEISRFILSRCLMKIRMAITTPSRITGGSQENASISSGMVAEAVKEARET